MKQLAFKFKITEKSIVVTILTILLLIFYFIFLNKIKYKCLFHQLGIWCPGCGGTRMIISFVNLDFYQAFRWNPLFFILTIFGIVYLIINVVMYIRKKVILVPTIKVIIFFIILLIIYMILRNVDMFSYLIPTKVR